MRRTDATRKVARALLADPDAHHWGYDTSRQAGVRSGVLYPILTRFLDAGWLADGWENPAEVKGRPPRRYYTVTAEGRSALAALADYEPSDRDDAELAEARQRRATGRAIPWAEAKRRIDAP